MKVLIVDDSVAFRAALRSALEDEGIEVIGEAANGREALEQMEQLTPEAVLVDLHMPRMDGLDLIPEIKKRAPSMRVGVVTAAGRSMVADAYDVGGDAYFRKEEPLDLVAAWLKGSGGGEP